MTVTSTPPGGGSETVDAVRVPGLVAAATWALGLAAGVFALFAGQMELAAVLLAVAVMAPLVGLAQVSRSKDPALGVVPGRIDAPTGSRAAPCNGRNGLRSTAH